MKLIWRYNLKTRFTKVAKYEANIKVHVSERFTVSSALYLVTETQLSNSYKFQFLQTSWTKTEYVKLGSRCKLDHITN